MGNPSGKTASWPHEERETPDTYWQGGSYPPVRPSAGGLYGGSPIASATYLAQRDQGPGAGGSFGGHPASMLSSAFVPQSTSYDWQRQQVQTAAMGADQDIVIIFDWDDTLMCSTAINNNQLQLHQAQQLEALLEQMLTTSMKLGETSIVTNADELWVLESTRRFAPRVLPILQQMSVVSARRKYERSFPGDVFAWKRETFREVLAGRRQTRGGMNLIVLGDSPAEMEAAQTATLRMAHPPTVKTVKFKETPSVEELLEQLHIVTQELASIVADDTSCCRNLVSWMRPQLQSSQVPTTATTTYAAPAPRAAPAINAYYPSVVPSAAAFATVAAAPSVAYFSNPLIYAAPQ